MSNADTVKERKISALPPIEEVVPSATCEVGCQTEEIKQKKSTDLSELDQYLDSINLEKKLLKKHMRSESDGTGEKSQSTTSRTHHGPVPKIELSSFDEDKPAEVGDLDLMSDIDEVYHTEGDLYDNLIPMSSNHQNNQSIGGYSMNASFSMSLRKDPKEEFFHLIVIS